MTARVSPSPAGVVVWPGRDVARVGLWWIALTVVVIAPQTISRTLRGVDSDPLDGYLATSLAHAVDGVLLAAAAVLAVWLVARRNGPPLLMMGLQRPSTRWVVIAAVAAAAVVADRLALLLLVGPVSATPADVLPAHLDPAALTGGWLTVNVVLAGLVTPVEEEILYRGVLFGWLHGWAGTVPAILGSAAIFAAVHTSLGATNTVLAFVGGAALAWIYTRSRSLLPAIVLHATWNTTSILVAALHVAG